MEWYVKCGLISAMENFSEHSPYGFCSICPSLSDNIVYNGYGYISYR